MGDRSAVAGVFMLEEDLLGGWALWIETWSQALRSHEVARAREDADAAWRDLLKSALPQDDPAKAEAFTQTLAALLDGFTIQVALADATVTPQVA